MHDQIRLGDLIAFYSILENLKAKIGGARKLRECSGYMAWPKRGVYFFFEPGEDRSDSGHGPRVIRVGTHALTGTSRSTLWQRLGQHRGASSTGGGNHRGSIFRLIVGTALIQRDGIACATWDDRKNMAVKEVRAAELALERLVSDVIGDMSFVWLPIEDVPGAKSWRGYVEKNSIALLSNYKKALLDPPSQNWLGHHCNRERVKSSGLWNQDHVGENYEDSFLAKLQQIVADVT